MGEIYFIELAKKFVWVFPVRYCGKNLNESFGQHDTWVIKCSSFYEKQTYSGSSNNREFTVRTHQNDMVRAFEKPSERQTLVPLRKSRSFRRTTLQDRFQVSLEVLPKGLMCQLLSSRKSLVFIFSCHCQLAYTACCSF